MVKVIIERFLLHSETLQFHSLTVSRGCVDFVAVNFLCQVSLGRESSCIDIFACCRNPCKRDGNVLNKKIEALLANPVVFLLKNKTKISTLYYFSDGLSISSHFLQETVL